MTMRTNKDLLVKSLIYLLFTLLSMFAAPVILFQAFKNEGHAIYPFLLQFGLVLAVAAIVLGFYSIHVMMRALFGAKN